MMMHRLTNFKFRIFFKWRFSSRTATTGWSKSLCASETCLV